MNFPVLWPRGLRLYTDEGKNSFVRHRLATQAKGTCHEPNKSHDQEGVL